MGIPGVADDNETDGIHVLIRRCAYEEALMETERVLGVELGRFCQAMLGETPLVHEVVEQVLLSFFDAMPALETAPLRPWLFGTAYRACARRLSAMDDSARAEALLLERELDGRLPPEEEATRRQARATRLSLEQVSRRARGVGLLRYAARLGYGDIATICGIEYEDAVKQTGRALLTMRDGRSGAPKA